VPPGYLRRPKLHTALQFYWDAFWELSADREVGFAMGRIPFTSIDRYAVRYEIDEIDEFDRFREMMRSMDAEFRRFYEPGKKPVREVSVKDLSGVKSVLSRFKQQGPDGNS